VAVLCGLGVVIVTVVLLIVLRPRDEGADTPPVSVPLPEEPVPTESIPTESIPLESLPLESMPTDTAVPPAP
jgi:hypothetical protein